MSDVSPARPKVVVLGAGFGGLAACGKLAGAPVDVLLVDQHTYNTFQPLLYEVATAGLNPGDIAFPIRSYTRRHANVDFRLARVGSVDFAAQTVRFDDGDTTAYDYLIIAIGAATNFFGVPGGAEHARGIYKMEDATAVRDDMARRLEHAASHGVSHGELTTVVVGGGPTGVEMAGTLAELRRVLSGSTYRSLSSSDARVVLVEQQDRLLSAFDEKRSAYAMHQLEKRGVEVYCGTAVKEVTATSVLFDSGERIECGAVIWAAGVGSAELTEGLSLPKMRGRVDVGPDLRVVGHDNVFAVGDVAAARAGDGNDAALPQLAQPAIQEGKHAAGQIMRLVDGKPTTEFRYHDKGIMATIGRRAAVAQLPNGIRLTGTLAWLAWFGLHLVFLLGFRNRAAVLMNWAWRYVSWRRGPRMIAGV